MIGIVLVTHGNMARGLIAALEHVVGPQQCVAAVCIGANDDMENRRAEILESTKACDTGDGVIVLTDLFGGTPSNLAISIMGQARSRRRLGRPSRARAAVACTASVPACRSTSHCRIRRGRDGACGLACAHDRDPSRPEET